MDERTYKTSGAPDDAVVVPFGRRARRV